MDSQKPETKNDEIDLGQLFARIGDAFGRMGTGFIRFLATLRRVPFENKTSFTLIILGSILLGVTFTFFIRKNYYESKMILSSDYLNKRLAESTIDKLDALSREEDKRGLSKTLGLADSLARNIISFDVRPFVDEKDVIDTEVLKEQLRAAKTDNPAVIAQILERIEIENRHAFEITVRTLTPSVIPNLQEAIVGYFKRNPYIAKRIDINKENLVLKKKKLATDIAKLDSLKSAIYESYRQTGDSRGLNTVFVTDKPGTNTVDVYNKDLSIYSEYQDVTRDLYLQKDFEIVDGFTEFSEPASPSLAVMLAYSILIGILVAYFDVALRNFNTYLANLK
ncbi:MAG: hypothetical protein WDO15_29075 [Bacteroidota bacterium]